jgi:hypothetical protein
VILDVVPVSSDGRIVKIKTYFENTGTLLLSAVSTQRIYDLDGNYITEIESSKGSVKPWGMVALDTELSLDGLNSSQFFVSTQVNYITGTAYKNSTIAIPRPTIATTAKAATPKAEESIWPMIIVVLLIIVIIIIFLLWRRSS